MKTKVLLFAMILTTALNVDEAQGEELPVSDVQNSGCVYEARGSKSKRNPTIVLEKEGSVLSVQLLNYEVNCCTDDFKVTSSMSDGNDGEPPSVSISVRPSGEMDCDCICPFNVSFTVRDLEPNSFYLNCWWYAGEINLKDGEPLILEDAYESVTIDGINYKLRKAFRFAMLTGCELVGELSIPSELSYEGETYSVMSISSNAFRDNTALTKVYIPKTIRNMDTWGKSGFGMNPFYSCMSLETIEVEEGNPELCSVDGVLFNKDKTTLIGYPVASPRESYSVPESVKAVASAAFYSNLFLKEIDLPESINYFGSIAFRNFSNLKDIYCHAKKVPGTDIYAFEGVNFSQITLHVPATSIENYQATSPWSQFGSIVPLEAQMAYHPFLKEGKTWNYQEYYHNVWDEEQWTKDVSYVIDGTTEIDGKTYYKMYRKSEKGSSYCCALREENRKVWMRTDDGDDRLLYDFGMSVGDSYKPYNEWSTFQLVDISPMRFNDELLNVFHYEVTTDYFGNGETVNVYPYSIVEGVGCDMGWNILELFYEVPSNGIIIREDFLSCYEDDKCIFTADDFKDLTNPKPQTAYYYYNGKKIPLTLNEDRVIVSIPKDCDGISKRIRANVPVLSTIKDEVFDCYIISRSDFENLTSKDFWEEDAKSVILTSSYYTENNEEVFETPYLNVELKKEEDAYLLDAYTEKYRLKNLGSSQYLPKWYVLYVTPESDKSPLQCANELYESGDFAASVPDFASDDYDIGVAYRPFVEEGKVWKVGSRGSGNPVQLVEYYYFEGDTIIDGKTCKQMMCQRFVSPEHPDYAVIMQYPLLRNVGAWYEENKKVYSYDTASKQFKIKYDFSLDTNDTLLIDNLYTYMIGPKQTGGLKGFKGVYRDIVQCWDRPPYYNTTWLEGVGGIDGPTVNVYYGEENHTLFLMSCTVGDEVIYLNDEYEDGATPEGARKSRFDFTHTVKTKPKAPRNVVGHAIPADAPTRSLSQRDNDMPVVGHASQRDNDERGEEASGMVSLYGEYNALQLDINLDPLDDAYQVSITNQSGQAVYEKTVNAGTVVALSIDISSYAKGRYTVTVENSSESFTGQFVAQTTRMYLADVNSDGAVNVADISVVISAMANGVGTSDLNGDVNGDGVVDVADISAIISIMTGL